MDKPSITPTATTAAQAAQWLAVDIANMPYLIPLTHSGEIYPWSKPQLVPYTQAWFLGVVNLRGSLCGVVDLSKFLKVESLLTASDQPSSGERCFVGFHASLELNTVLVVDQLLGLKNASAMQPKESNSTSSCQFVDSDGRVWQEIDMFGLAKDAAFINIAVNYGS